MKADMQLEPLFVCAFCPSACRRAIPAELDQQLEMRLPSALALLAVNLRQGMLPHDADMRAALSDLGVARMCSKVCSYGYDVPAQLEAFSREMDALHDKGQHGTR
jgi:hypothetical protein